MLKFNDLVSTVNAKTKVYLYAKPEKSKDAKFREYGVAGELDLTDTADLVVKTFTVSAGRINVTLN